MAEAVDIAMAIAVVIVIAIVVGSMCTYFGIVVLTWNLDGLQI